VVECGGLENRCSVSTGPGVRIPLSPQSLNALRQLAEGFLFLRSDEESLLSEETEAKIKKTRWVI
jgi:hypothetical protein